MAKRLTCRGQNVYDPDGNLRYLTGWNWDNLAYPEPDAAALKARGGTLCRVNIEFLRDSTGSCTGFPGNSKNDAYMPGAPGNLNPTILGVLDAKVNALSAAGIWIDLGCSGGDCDFFTNPIYIPQWQAMWTFLSARYANVDYIAWYEPLIEPAVPGDPNPNVTLTTLYQNIVPIIRANDPNVPIMVGAAKVYNIRNVQQVYLGPIQNILYTADFYELGGGPTEYVEQAKINPPVSLPWNNNPPYGGYPGVYDDSKGRRPGTGGNYYQKGSHNFLMNKDTLGVPGDGSGNGLLSVLTTFCAQYNVPGFIQQIGIRSVTPNSLQWLTDMLDNFNAAGIGWAVWDYRTIFNNGSILDGDIGLVWQDANGQWHDKDDWLQAVSERFIPAPPAPVWTQDGTWTIPIAGGAPVQALAYNPGTLQALVIYADGSEKLLKGVPLITNGLAGSQNQQAYVAALVAAYSG